LYHAISPTPLANILDKAPANYLFHHHLGIDLLSQSAWFQQAQESYFWQAKPHHSEVAYQQCLEIAVPWSDLQINPDANLNLLIILAEDGEFRELVLEEKSVVLQVP
jgi:hypothetical protein